MTGGRCTCLFSPEVDDGAWVSGSCPVHVRDWAGRVHELEAETEPAREVPRVATRGNSSAGLGSIIGGAMMPRYVKRHT